MIKIIIKKGSIVKAEVDAIVNPSNSCGLMGGGVAGFLKKVGGKEIEEEAIHQAPTHIGQAIITTSGLLKARKIIHAPTMENPAERTDSHKVKCSVEAALELADKEGFGKIAFPGMGTGVGRLDKKEAAKTMIDTIKIFAAKYLQEVQLIDIDEKMVKAWKESL